MAAGPAGGAGPVNQKGLDYYRALLDELASNGISAAVTLYHWDLPQELQDAGGWAVRSTAGRFAEYAAIMAEQLGDRVARWITVNEPQVVASHGYRDGVHAPGLRDDAAATAATHHLLLGHGLAVQALRSVHPTVPVGITLDLHPVRVPAGVQPDVVEQARLITDAEVNGLFLEPVLNGRYPAHARAALLPEPPLVADGDLETISQPIDFLGVNYYAPVYIRAGDPDDLRRNEEPADCGLPGVVEYRPAELERTAMGWLVDPDGLLRPAGAAVEGRAGTAAVHHRERLRGRGLREPARRRQRPGAGQLPAQAPGRRGPRHQAGVNLAGYYVWSLLDNFEWGWGYQKRFGIVYVDFETQRRIPKSSARFYSEVVRANAIPPLAADGPAA